VRHNKYGRDLNEVTGGKFDFARRVGIKGDAMFQQHCVGRDRKF
jgi:hypothetical protein